MAPIDAAEAARLIDDVCVRTGHRFEFVGMPNLGATDGAAFVRWPDGRAGVLSCSARPRAELERTGEILDHLRARGIPAPHYELIVELPGTTVIVQERLAGAPTPRHIDYPMMSAILDMADRFSGVLADQPDVPAFELVLHGTRTASLACHDDRTRLLLDWIGSIGARAPRMTGDDLIHCDYHRDNILFDENGGLTGIVDWHDTRNLRRGDCRYQAVHLAFDFAWALARDWNVIDPAAMQLLDQAIAAIEPETVDAYWANDALRMVDMLLSRQWYESADAIIDFALTRVP
jgi:aminoglycoside phosphotransferase (APT) family kinase protein